MSRLIVFLGPSLPASEAKAIARGCEVLPPARQGDIWRVLPKRPKAIALIDGVFESTPSVWHHELLTALASGVAVFGSSSMGALRAAELHTLGMIGVGKIFADYRDGRRVDDADVALLHADEENQFRPITVPLVNVEHAASLAKKARLLSTREANALVQLAGETYYQERGWPQLLRALEWKPELRERFRDWLREAKPDLKAEDARACLKAADELVRSGAPLAPSAVPRSGALGSSLVRRRRLWSDGGEQLGKLRARPDAAELIEAGRRRSLLAGIARSKGLRADPEALASTWKTLRRKAPSLSNAELDALAEDVVLERLLVENAARLLPDGSGEDEALASEAAVRGLLRR